MCIVKELLSKTKHKMTKIKKISKSLKRIEFWRSNSAFLSAFNNHSCGFILASNNASLIKEEIHSSKIFMLNSKFFHSLKK